MKDDSVYLRHIVDAIKDIDAYTVDGREELFGYYGDAMLFRTIVVYKKEEKAIFLYGFGKNEKSNIDKAELRYFKKLGSDLLAIDARQVTNSIKKQILFDLEGTE